MGVYVKGTPKEGEYKLIKTTDGFVLDGKDIAYACTEIDLVRCGECKHMEVDKYSGQMECTWGFEIECDDPYCGAWLIVNPKDFCPNGERDEDFDPYQGERDRDENGEIY